MTEYWKSQDRKYCEFCKCWITDNKPSVQFHETGKRHKENVAKKISELTKKSTKAQKENDKINVQMKQMEEAAMRAYMKDMESNPDFTSLQYKEELEKKNAAQDEEVKELVKKVVERVKEAPPDRGEKKPTKKLWQEAKSPEGHTYYWNTETNETVWEPPVEGYVTLGEQTKAAETAAKEAERRAEVASEELRAWQAREAMRAYRKQEEPTEEAPAQPVAECSGPVIGPPVRADPYGRWTAVETRVEVPIDWQLPQSKKGPEIVVPQVSEPRVKIKEKKFQSLGDLPEDLPTVFKKRKLNKGNVRQRMEDE